MHFGPKIDNGTENFWQTKSPPFNPTHKYSETSMFPVQSNISHSFAPVHSLTYSLLNSPVSNYTHIHTHIRKLSLDIIVLVLLPHPIGEMVCFVHNFCTHSCVPLQILRTARDTTSRPGGYDDWGSSLKQSCCRRFCCILVKWNVI